MTNRDLNNFGPQLGFAWSPSRFSGKLVIRGGVGMGYDRLPNALLANARAMQLARVTPNTQDPAGGRVIRDAAGAAAGVFVDNAQSLITRAISSGSPIR